MFLELKNNHFILKQFNFVYLLVKNFQERQSTKITQKKKPETRRNSMAGYCFA